VLLSTVALTPLAFFAPHSRLTTWWFAGLYAPINGWFLWRAYKFYRNSTTSEAQKLFLFSLLHLPLSLVSILITAWPQRLC
jgi:heme O synthase-like polyprenyltransferase